MPSFTLLAQSVLSGLFVGGLYGLLGLGLSLSWGLLRLINLAHFALALPRGVPDLRAVDGASAIDPFWSLLVVPPAFFGLGVLSQALFTRFGVTQFGSLLVTFGLTVIIESLIQWIWTADYRKLETAYGTASWRAGGLFLPKAEMLALGAAVLLAVLTWAWLRFTWVGKGLRACAEEPQIAAAFGVNHRRLALVLSGLGAAFAGVAGAFIALIYTLAPSQIYAWIGVVFAAVILGGLGNPLGPSRRGRGHRRERGADHGVDRARLGARSCPSRF